MKQVEYTDSEFNMRREFYEKTVREVKKSYRKVGANRSNSKRIGRFNASKSKS